MVADGECAVIDRNGREKLKLTEGDYICGNQSLLVLDPVAARGLVVFRLWRVQPPAKLQRSTMRGLRPYMPHRPQRLCIDEGDIEK